jgi:DNA-binding SARP family transcriptional activator
MGGGGVVELGILGPLVVLVDDEQVALGPTLKALVLALLCARGSAVPIARLGGQIAEPGRDSTEAATVRSHVSHLRKALRDDQERRQGPKVLVSVKVGGAAAYALRTEAIDTDATRFDRLVDEGHAELREGNYQVAAEILRGALALWRGDPLADAGGRSFARDWIEHLESRHRQARIARAASDVGAMRHADVAGELDRMVRRWPDDEVVRALLAIALYRSGRVSGAAVACQDAIRAAQSHGLDSPRLHRLQRDVLNGTLPEAGLPYLPWQTDLPRAFHVPSTAFHGISTR